jgi:hypothetical protein
MSESNTDSDNLKCPKLNDTNWKPWSALVYCHLESKELLDAIQNTPPEGSLPKARAKKDAQARKIIMQCAGFEKSMHILHLRTAYDMWHTLKTIHQPAGQAQMASLLQSFFGYTRKAKGTVDTAASELTVIQSDIRLIDPEQAPSDQAKLAILLLLFRRSDSAYEPVVLHIESSADPDFATAISQLKDAERRILEAESSSKTHDTALSAGSKDKKKKKKSKEPLASFKVEECYHCHSTNHIKPQCPKYLKSKDSNESKGSSKAHVGKSTSEKISLASDLEDSLGPASGKAWITRSYSAVSVDEKSVWVVDSSASRHMTGDCTLFVEGYKPLMEPDRIEIADGSYLEGIGIGNIKLTLKGSPQQEVTVLDVLYVPNLATNLMSVIQLEDHGIIVATSGSGAMNLLRGGKIIGRASRIGRSYILDTVNRPMVALSAKSAPKSAIDWALWHWRFGHIGREKLLDLYKVVQDLEPLEEVPLGVCEPCIFSKQLRIVNRVPPKRATVPLGRVYSDV